MNKPKRIFISPLDWGLGHTTRCISIAKELHKLGHKIFFGVNKTQQALLEKETPFAEFIEFEGYNIQYPKFGSMTAKMLIQIPKILSRIQSETKDLNELIDKYNFDLVISDNRFGLHTSKIPCIYITHQINIQAPVFKQALHNLHEKFIKKYNYCWIPDYEAEKESLGGSLSHQKLSDNCRYVGPLSRFNSIAINDQHDYDYLAIISGPEPQRSQFEEIILKNFKRLPNKCAIIGGKPTENNKETHNNVSYFPHLESVEFLNIVSRSKNIICRPGYSSIMDFQILQKPVHFIPTPGQTEQIYLAKFHEKNGIEWSNQRDLRINHMLFNRLPKRTIQSPLTTEIKRILEIT